MNKSKNHDTNIDTAARPRSCKRSDTLFQKSLLLFLTWREYFYSQPTHFSSQPKKYGFKQSFAPFTRPWGGEGSIDSQQKFAFSSYDDTPYKLFSWFKLEFNTRDKVIFVKICTWGLSPYQLFRSFPTPTALNQFQLWIGIFLFNCFCNQ